MTQEELNKIIEQHQHWWNKASAPARKRRTTRRTDMELKAFVARKIDDGSCDPVPCIEVYTKSEADKVIAEKDAEIVELKKQVHDYAQGLYVIQARAENEARHQKYKRCLAMAKLCRSVWAAAIFIHEKGGTDKQSALYMKWEKRWLELAEKFKEAK